MSANKGWKVLIVEDQKMAREHMEGYVEASDEYCLVGSMANASLAELFCMKHPVDIVVMDVCTANDENGIEAAARIKKNFPKIKIVIVTSMVECSYLERAKAAGAESFWYKDAGREELMEVMTRTMQGESIYPARTPEVQVGLASSYEFTEGELKVLRLVVEGMSYDEIAKELGVSVSAVRFHITNLLQKTGYGNKTQLAIAVTNKKLIIPTFS